MTKTWAKQEPFVHLTNSELAELAEAAQASRYPKGAVLFREGDPADFLWVLQRGWIHWVKQTCNGKPLTLDLITPKDGVCGLSALSGGDRYLATAVAATAIEAVRLPAVALRRILRSHAPFAACVTGIFSHRFQQIAAAYADAYAPVEQRISSVLLRLKDDFGTSLPVTRREVAALAGTTVETAIRITRRMQEEGILRISRGRITLLQPKALSEKMNQTITRQRRENVR